MKCNPDLILMYAGIPVKLATKDEKELAKELAEKYRYEYNAAEEFKRILKINR